MLQIFEYLEYCSSGIVHFFFYLYFRTYGPVLLIEHEIIHNTFYISKFKNVLALKSPE